MNIMILLFCVAVDAYFDRRTQAMLDEAQGPKR